MCVPNLRQTFLDQLEEREDFQMRLRLLLENEENDENEVNEEGPLEGLDLEVQMTRTAEEQNWYRITPRFWFPTITLEQYNLARRITHQPVWEIYQEFQNIIDWNVNIFQNSPEFDEYMTILNE